MSIPIFCGTCGTTGAVNKVTAGLQCRCGSTDIGLQGVDEMPARLAAPQGPGSGWFKPMPDPASNWSEYAGPQVGPNPKPGAPVADSMVCPVCHGAGYDISDHTICRECGGSGVMTATTARPEVEQYDSHQGPPSGGARHASGGVRLQIRPGEYQGDQGHHVSGTDGRGRTVRVFAPGDRAEAEQVVENIKAGKSAFAHHAGRTSHPESAEYQNMHGGGYYQGQGAPQGQFSDGDEKTWFPKADTRSPATRVRQNRPYEHGDNPYPLNEADCPECGHRPTQLVKTPADKAGNQDGVWHCPNCGPLVNIDKNPSIDPYRPRETGYDGPDRSALKKRSGLRVQEHTGKLFPLLSSILGANALSHREALTLARQTLTTYPEGRA